VITQGAPEGGSTVSEARYYPGDKYFEAGSYDHIFDVEDDTGARKLIPYNDGGNPLEAAEKYCAR
jgi:phospholipase A-2-activating protein